MTPHRDEPDLSEDPPSFLTEACKKFKKKAQIVAVASAIGDVIEEQGGPLVPASDGKEKTEEEIGNLLSLLAFVFEKASAAILRAKFAHVCGVLMNIFSQCPESVFILVKLTSCVSLLLQAQDSNTLHQQDGLSCVHFLLTLSADERNGVARAAHVGLLSIFKSSNTQTRKNLSGVVANFVHKYLTSQPTPSEATLVSILKLVKNVFRYLSANHIGALCEDILRLPMLAHSSVTAASFQSIFALVNENDVDEDEDEEKLVTLQAPQLITLVDTLIDMQPHFNDTKPLMDYSVLMAGLLSALASVDDDACAKRLPNLVEHLVVNFAAENNDIKQITHDALVTLVNDCISEKMIKQAVSSQKAPLRSVVESLESALAPKYNRSWDKGLLVIAALFDKLGAHSGEMLGSSLATVGELYNTLTPQTHMPVFAVLGYAISSMGPKKFLEILPLNLESEAQSGPTPNRSWLIPLLRTNIEQTELKFFVDYFIPLANQVAVWSKRAEGLGRVVEAKNKQILHDQIWDLFPSFCNLPTDVTQNFKTIARTLGTLLKDNESLRKVLCTGLLKLIEKNVEVAALPEESTEFRVTPAVAKSGLKAMAQFTSNFLPIFFTIFEKLGPTDNKDTLFNLISAYLKISEPQVVSTFFRKLMEKLLEASIEPKKEEEDEDEMEDDEREERRKEAAEAEKARKALVDAYSSLSSAFVPALSSGDLDFLFRVIKPFFKSTVVHTQKRAYKILRGMCTRDIFVKKNYDEVRNLVIKTGDCSSAAKKQRIFVLAELQPRMALEEVTSPTLLADIIFCSREINAAARKVALQMLIAIAHRVQTEDAESGLKNYLNLVIAGLAGTTPVMISGSISALTALVNEFKDVISPIFIKDLFFTMTLLLQSKYAEVMTETISFLKATISMVDTEDMRPALKQLVDGFAYMMQEHKGKFRDHGVHVVVRLLKRYGYDTLLALFPEDCHKVLRAINKRERQKKDKSNKKEKGEGEGEESDSDESDSEFLGDNLVGGNKTYDQQDKPETFIIEDEEPIDFLDKKAMKRVISAKPQEQKEKQKKKSEFKMLPDGRLLIQDSDDDEDSHNIYFGKTSEKLPIDDRMMDSVDRELFGSKSRRMTKKRMLENDRKEREDADSDDEVDQVQPMNEKFKKNNRPKATTQYAGHQFRAKKAGGDIKIGKLEPFAYIPLDVRNLNKRRRHQAVNAFKPIAKASKGPAN